MYNHVGMGKDSQRLFQEEKPGSEPMSKESVNFGRDGYRIDKHFRSQNQGSSNYFTMRNGSYGASDPINIVSPTGNLIQSINPTPNLRMTSNVLQTPVEVKPFTGQKNYPVTPVAQFNLGNSQLQNHNFKFQYIQTKRAYHQLLETHNRVLMDLDLTRHQLKISKNNEEFLSRNNIEIAEQIKSLKINFSSIQKELIATRTHKEELFKQLKLTAQNGPAQTPSLTIPRTLNENSSFSPPGSYEIQNLLCRIQQYEATMLYKNEQIKKHQREQKNLISQLQSTKNDFNQLKQQFEVYMQRQNQREGALTEILRQKSGLIAETTMIPVLQAECQRLKRENYMLEREISELKKGTENLMNLQDKFKNLQMDLAEQRKKNEALKVKLADCQRLLNYQQNMQTISQIPPINPEVLTSYIGDEAKNIASSSNEQKINQAIYQNAPIIFLGQEKLSNSTKNVSYHLPHTFHSQNTNHIPLNLYQSTKNNPQQKNLPQIHISTAPNQKTQLKIIDEAYFDFSKQNQQGNLDTIESKSIPFEKQTFSNFYQQPKQVTHLSPIFQKQVPSKFSNQHNQIQQKSCFFKKKKIVGFHEPHSILGYPQLPFRPQTFDRKNKNLSFDQKCLDNTLSYISGQRQRHNMTENNIMRRAQRDYDPEKGNNSMTEVNKAFQRKIYDLIQENKMLKTNLQAQIC